MTTLRYPRVAPWGGITNGLQKYPLPVRGLDFPRFMNLPVINALVDETERNIQAPRPLIFNGVLAAISLAQQGLYDVKKPNGQTVPTSLYIFVIADSGERKSTSEDIFLGPIRKFQLNNRSRYIDDMREFNAKNKIWSTKKHAIIKVIGNKASEGLNSDQEEERLIEHERNEPKKPRECKLIYEDSTTEALFYGLDQKWPTAGLISSEGSSVLNSTAINDFSKQNSIWSGGSITVDRKSKPSFDLVGCRLTVSLMVQRSAFESYMIKHGDSARGSGFWARFLVAYPISTQGSRFVTTGTQSWEHKTKYDDRLYELLEQNVAVLNSNSSERSVVQLTPQASERWFQVVNAIEAEISPGGRFEGAGDHASKLADNIARVAANFHSFEGFEGDISLATLEIAISVCFWYSDQFLNLFMAISQEALDAYELDAWFRSICFNGQRYIRKNEVRQYGPNRLRDRRKLQTVLELLQLEGKIFLLVVGRTTIVDLLPWLQYDAVSAQKAIVGHVG